METSPMMCRCGHPRTVHEHYRRGDDCGACGPVACAGFARAADDNVVHFRQQVVQRLRARGARPAARVAMAPTAAAARSLDTEAHSAV